MSLSSPPSVHGRMSDHDYTLLLDQISTQSDSGSTSQSQSTYFRRLADCDKRTTFITAVVIAGIAFLSMYLLLLVFLPILPDYSLCTQQIHWGNTLGSIIQYGYPVVNLTLHMSIYNPNHFSLDLHSLDVYLYYKNAYVGYAQLSSNQTTTTTTSTMALSHIVSTIPTTQIYNNSTRNGRGDNKDKEHPFLTFVPFSTHNFISQDNYKYLMTYIAPYISSYSQKIANNNNYLFPTFISSSKDTPSYDSIIDNNDPNTILSFPPPSSTSLLQDPVILPGGSIADMLLDARIEPSLAQALEMLVDYHNENLLLSVAVAYKTNVYTYVTPKIMYNATYEFVNINVSESSSFNGDGTRNYCLCPNGT